MDIDSRVERFVVEALPGRRGLLGWGARVTFKECQEGSFLILGLSACASQELRLEGPLGVSGQREGSHVPESWKAESLACLGAAGLRSPRI